MIRINRGCLYVLLGRVNEAETLLREALDHVHPRRSYYRMFAQDALTQIEQWRKQTAAARLYQLDWRWVERYRRLAAFDSYWWLAPAGPFTEDEQRQWNQLFTPDLDEVTEEQLKTIITQSREREFAAAISEQHLPRLHYPAIEIEEVRQRIADLLELQSEIERDERNAIVRQLYHGTIEEEVWFLQLIEATYDGDSARFWEVNLRLNPKPTAEEMHYALSRVRRILLQGILLAVTAGGEMEQERREAIQEAGQCVIQFMRDRLQLSPNLSYAEQEAQELRLEAQLPSSQPRRMVSAQTARRFLEAILYLKFRL